MRPLSQRLVGWAATAILLLALAGVLIVVAASLIFLKLRGVTDAPMPAALWSWVPYYLRWGSDPRVRSDLLLSIGAPAGFVALLAGIMVVAACKSRRRLRPARKGERPPAPVRAASDVHGNADWLEMAEVRRLFPGPHPAYGGVVVGEAYRVDQDKVAAVRFDPADRSTWGQGGKAPLLIDPCTADATHGAVFAGCGGYKTTADHRADAGLLDGLLRDFRSLVPGRADGAADAGGHGPQGRHGRSRPRRLQRAGLDRPARPAGRNPRPGHHRMGGG